jgi:large subunit ribosomal protein L10Ae
MRDYDPDKRFNGSVRLPHIAYNKVRVCVMANAIHIEECTANNIPFIDVDGLKAFNKDKTKIKKWCKKYDIILASDSVAKQVTKLLGNVLVKLGKFPIALAEGEKILPKIEEVRHTVKFQSKKASCLGTAIGTVETGEENLRQNITMSINFLVSLMKKGWQNIGTLHLKTSMGKSYRIFG